VRGREEKEEESGKVMRGLERIGFLLVSLGGSWGGGK
jgi:hypothetical protein